MIIIKNYEIEEPISGILYSIIPKENAEITITQDTLVSEKDVMSIPIDDNVIEVLVNGELVYCEYGDLTVV